MADSSEKAQVFDPSKAITLWDWRLTNHDEAFDDQRLVEWAKENADHLEDTLSEVREAVSGS